jgi:hypothetical protein
VSQLRLFSLFQLGPILSHARLKFALKWSTTPWVRLAVLIALLSSSEGCEKRENSLVDAVGRPPLLVQITTSPSSFNSDSINVGASRKPDDLLPLAAIITARTTAYDENPLQSVRFSIKSPSGDATLAEGVLVDDGSGADQSKGDGIYSGKATFQIQRVEVGVFRIEVSAQALNGFKSNTVIAPISVFRGNKSPVISDLQAPDTVQLGNDSQLLTLRIKVSDPDGLSDVVRVVFNSFRPDGGASSGNPFQMYDDGSATHGDDKAGDGSYSLIITLPPTSQTGTYRFEFQAFDRSNEGSNIIIHRITVRQ